MKYVVFGAGMMGSAAAWDLAVNNPADEVVVADINLEVAHSVARSIGMPNVTPRRVDVHDDDDVARSLEGAAAAIGAVSYSVNYDLNRAAIEAGVHMCDLGGNNDMVTKQLTLDAGAKARGVTIVPNCGLAPGLINILAVEGARQFDSLDSIRLRVGGLPQNPRPPLDYQVVFSVEGLINEYVERAEVIRDGVHTTIDPMSGLEDIEFPPPFGTLEAFSTSGGLSWLPRLFEGKVRELDYKTIRYCGHCEKFKTLLDLGFATNEPMMMGGGVKTNREFFEDLLKRKLDYGDRDVVLARATITGTVKEARRTLVYEFIDYYDETTKITAMMRTTAFPTTVIASMLATGAVTARGVLTPELCVPGDVMIRELAKRNIRITTSVTETWS
jgi:lysine 6-dehydrogenase